jgi:hypothetical protein
MKLYLPSHWSNQTVPFFNTYYQSLSHPDQLTYFHGHHLHPLANSFLALHDKTLRYFHVCGLFNYALLPFLLPPPTHSLPSMTKTLRFVLCFCIIQLCQRSLCDIKCFFNGYAFFFLGICQCSLCDIKCLILLTCLRLRLII